MWEIRTLRATWRGLETGLRDGLRHRHKAKAAGNSSLDMDAPEPLPVQRPEMGPVRKLPEVGGLPHHYERMVAREVASEVQHFQCYDKSEAT